MVHLQPVLVTAKVVDVFNGPRQRSSDPQATPRAGIGGVDVAKSA
jgi:hypothetical protein